ncbi:MAG: hypothetical protein ACTJGI_07725, partial [Corynebacterium casei]|uniref:hypothetical protein n=1 Tax=Corynebacterium casei TaxID=160386 RepID=UPI003F8DF385
AVFSLSWSGMTVEIITTEFIAKPEDLDRAYALYKERIARADARILAYSSKPIPSSEEFGLWFLRTQAVYDRLDSPIDWQLYELNAIVEWDGSDDEEEIDALRENFFFEDLREPTAFPASLGGVFDMKLLREPKIAAGQGDLTYVTVAFFTYPDNLLKVPELFSEFVAAVDPIVHGGAPTEAEEVHMPQYAGPLWMKAAQTELDETGDGIHHGAKRMWLGCVVIDYDAEKLAEHLPESLDPDNFVLASLYPEPF